MLHFWSLELFSNHRCIIEIKCNRDLGESFKYQYVLNITIMVCPAQCKLYNKVRLRLNCHAIIWDMIVT